MIEIVINYDQNKQMYGVYEPTTNTYILSANLSEALVYLEKFLKDSQMITSSLLDCTEISYHLDSYSMKSMIESNVALMKRLSGAPSGFTVSQQRFGGTSNLPNKNNNKGFSNKGGSTFSNSGFKSSYKKFGNK